jgi:hypothetical protein
MALFTEMFGLPLTIYFLGSVFGVNLGFGRMEGQLWAVLLDRLRLLPLRSAFWSSGSTSATVPTAHIRRCWCLAGQQEEARKAL